MSYCVLIIIYTIDPIKTTIAGPPSCVYNYYVSILLLGYLHYIKHKHNKIKNTSRLYSQRRKEFSHQFLLVSSSNPCWRVPLDNCESRVYCFPFSTEILWRKLKCGWMTLKLCIIPNGKTITLWCDGRVEKSVKERPGKRKRDSRTPGARRRWSQVEH